MRNRQIFFLGWTAYGEVKKAVSVIPTFVVCVVFVRVNVESPVNGESSLSSLHLCQCNSIITSNHSHIHSKMNFPSKAVLYSNPTLISYHIINFNILYTWQIVLLVCLYMYIEDLYTNTYCTVSD